MSEKSCAEGVRGGGVGGGVARQKSGVLAGDKLCRQGRAADGDVRRRSIAGAEGRSVARAVIGRQPFPEKKCRATSFVLGGWPGLLGEKTTQSLKIQRLNYVV